MIPPFGPFQSHHRLLCQSRCTLAEVAHVSALKLETNKDNLRQSCIWIKFKAKLYMIESKIHLLKFSFPGLKLMCLTYVLLYLWYFSVTDLNSSDLMSFWKTCLRAFSKRPWEKPRCHHIPLPRSWVKTRGRSDKWITRGYGNINSILGTFSYTLLKSA